MLFVFLFPLSHDIENPDVKHILGRKMNCNLIKCFQKNYEHQFLYTTVKCACSRASLYPTGHIAPCWIQLYGTKISPPTMQIEKSKSIMKTFSLFSREMVL